jgi:septal ring factor EnvC (AmiA/AmiB activator)
LKNELDDNIRNEKTVGGLMIGSSDQDRIEYLLNFHKDGILKLRKVLEEESVMRQTIGNLNSQIQLQKDEISKLRKDLDKKRNEIKELEDEKTKGRFDYMGGV